jgi:hypothetical protein
MARYSKSNESERRTAQVTVQLAPTERQKLQAEAEQAGAALSEHIRQLCLGRAAGVTIVAGTRRNPEAKALMNELSAIGNNLNQLARHANTNGRMPEVHELRRTLDVVKSAMARVIAL